MLEPPQDDEEPPTLLANTGRFEGASGLTSFYTTPAYRAWDPSIIVLISFAIFFAMILADAGYALVLCAGAFLVSGRIKRRAGGRQALAVVWAVLATALVYGVLAGSYFGLTLPPDSVLARLALIDVEDIETMMMVSIIVGVIHISIANGVAAYSARRASDIRNKLGWIAATWGGLAMWLGAPVAGAAVLAGGLLAVFVARWPDRPVQRPLDWLWRVADGGLALTRVTTLFGDVLSYMRLFALGLASASLAATFNGIASGIVEGMPGVGLLLALLVLLFGHGINLTLGIMSGLVHGLRLNFIEFFGWALSGEGYPFRPLARKERPTWTD
jgi:V/A-type H+-transporting ATPase subunit I